VLTLAAAVAAGLLCAAPEPPALQGDARVDAGTAVYDLASGTYRLTGGVVIRRGLVTLRAASAAYDPRSGEVTAAGGVLLSDATRVLAADTLRAVLGGDLAATGVVALIKDAPVDLGGAATSAEAAACGHNRLTASAASLTGRTSGSLELVDARLSLCDCPSGGAPSWQLRARGASVTPGRRVELTWPVLYVTPRFLGLSKPVPVLAVPWLSLPLSDRESGLLAPQIGYDGTSGLSVELPWFQTMGRSADLTVSPRYAFGTVWPDTRHEVVRGPGGSIELRWATSARTAGRLQADALWDLADESDGSAGVRGVGGLRLALRGAVAQALPWDGSLRADLDLVGDPLYVRDFTQDVLLRGAAARRSALTAARRFEGAALELSAAWLEPVGSAGVLDSQEFGLFGARLPAFHRWPALAAHLLPTSVVGPLRLSGRAGVARFAPRRGLTSDGGPDGLGPADRGYTRDAADAGEGDGRWEPGERLAATRLDARAELSAPFHLGGALSVLPFVRGAALAYAFDAAADPLANGWVVGGLSVSTVLSRRFGAVRHTLEPRLDWRLGGAVGGEALPAFGYDEWDRAAALPPGAGATFRAPRLAAAAPPGPFHQARLAVATRVAEGERELWRAEVGQDLDLRRGRLAEGYLTAAAARGLVSGEAELRLWTGGRLEPGPAAPHRSWLDAFSQARLRLAVADRRGDAVKVGLLSVAPGGSGQLQAGVDALFDPRAADVGTFVPGADWSLASATLGLQVKLGPATLGYEAQLPVRDAIVRACRATDGSMRTVGPWQVRQHVGAVEWDSPCRCFRVRATVRYDDCGGVAGGLALDLGGAAR